MFGRGNANNNILPHHETRFLQRNAGFFVQDDLCRITIIIIDNNAV